MVKNKKMDSRKFNSVSDPKIHRLANNLVKRHRNLFVYMVFGFIAALINTVVFMVLH
ncbi:MAG: GtrA family protein, partial [Lactobacillus sp.]|nr:GtrA family protein [Lactobacillus sp.]